MPIPHNSEVRIKYAQFQIDVQKMVSVYDVDDHYEKWNFGKRSTKTIGA
jgi:hypothetical protein